MLPAERNSKELLNSVKHILDLFNKTFISPVCFRRHPWLRSTDLQLDTKMVIEDLPFEGEGHLSYDRLGPAGHG